MEFDILNDILSNSVSKLFGTNILKLDPMLSKCNFFNFLIFKYNFFIKTN